MFKKTAQLVRDGFPNHHVVESACFVLAFFCRRLRERLSRNFVICVFFKVNILAWPGLLVLQKASWGVGQWSFMKIVKTYLTLFSNQNIFYWFEGKIFHKWVTGGLIWLFIRVGAGSEFDSDIEGEMAGLVIATLITWLKPIYAKTSENLDRLKILGNLCWNLLKAKIWLNFTT